MCEDKQQKRFDFDIFKIVLYVMLWDEICLGRLCGVVCEKLWICPKKRANDKWNSVLVRVGA